MKWIPVNEKLPDCDDRWGISKVVLCLDARGRVGFGIYQNGEKQLYHAGWFTGGDVGKGSVTVTHWMPLPELSKEDYNRGNEFKKIWNSASGALYNLQGTAKILKSFNDAIHGLYFLSSEENYIFSVLNTTTYQNEEYKRLTKSIGIELVEVANKLELMRSILFGDCFNWDAIYDDLEL